MLTAFLKSLLTLIFICLALTLTFAFDVWHYASYNSNYKDHGAIVVLTGGSNRVEKGIELYEQGYAKTLFISGTHPEVTQDVLFSEYDLDPCCLVLDPLPINTHENALNTTKWLEANTIDSFLLVTSDYHMPRALIEFRRTYQSGLITPVSVKPKDFSYTDLYSWKIFMKECLKYWSVRFANLFNIGLQHVYYS